MEKKNFCPILNGNCKEKSCMWYVTGLDKCAVNSVAQAFDSLTDMIEEIKDTES